MVIELVIDLRAQPAFTVHLKQDVVADLAARATPITDPAQRRAILAPLLQRLAQRSGQRYELA